MPRAKNKQQLLEDYKKQYAKLNELIDSFSEQKQNSNFGFVDRDRNIKDVLTHLYEWQKMMLRWYQEGCIQGIKPIIPREGYTWKTTAKMNEMIWHIYQKTSLEEAKILLNTTHHQLVDIIENLSEEQLYAKKYYKWTGSTTLGQYLVSAGPSHYDWAFKKIMMHKKINQ